MLDKIQRNDPTPDPKPEWTPNSTSANGEFISNTREIEHIWLEYDAIQFILKHCGS